MSDLVRVVAPHFVAGIEINERGMCLHAAPILKWCIGKRADFLRDYFKGKGWKASIVTARTDGRSRNRHNRTWKRAQSEIPC